MSSEVSDQAPLRRRVRVRRTKPWWKRRRVRGRILVGLGILGFLALLDGAWAATTSVRGLQQVRFQLQAAAEDLAAGRLDDAASRFRLAHTFADRAGNLVLHPAAAVADVLPFIGDDIDAIQTMAHSVVRVADAGSALVRGAQAVGWDGSGLPGSTSGGRIDLDPIEDAAPFLDQAAGRMGEARRILEPVRPEDLFGPVANATRSVRLAVAERERDMSAVAGLAEILPGFLGSDVAREYFLALQNLSAPRGTGGFLGLYGILRVEDGVAELETLDHAGRLGQVPPVDAPPDVEARYARFGGTTHFIAANYSPDFPTTAEVILEMWEASGRGRLDGVIATDPVWVASLLQTLGPVETPAWPEPLTAENLSDVLQSQTFTLPQPDSDRAQEAIGEALFGALLERPLPARGLAQAMDRGAREGHLRVYSRHGEEEALFVDLQVSGRVEVPANPVFVVWQDAVSSRSGYYAERETDVRVELGTDGSALVETEVTLVNGAPDGPPSLLLGDGSGGDPVGYFAAYVNVYLPQGAEDVRTEVRPGPALDLLEEEFGHPVAMELLGAGSGETATLRVSYRVAGGVRRVGDSLEYRLGFLPQASLRPGALSVEVALPEGAEVDAAAPGLVSVGPLVRFRGAPIVPRDFWVRFHPT